MSLPDKIPDFDSMSLSDLDDEDEYPVELPDDNPFDATVKAIDKKPFTYMLIHAKNILPQGRMFNLPRFRGEQRTMMETWLAILTPTQL